MKVVIIGGVAGGATAAARLRRLDEEAEIIILERTGYVSYANCGLPYFVGGVITDRDELTLQTPEGFRRRFGIDVRVGHEALEINPAEHTVEVRSLADGSTYTESYDKLILSPGARPVMPGLPGEDDPRVFTLRTVEDTFRIRDYLDTHPVRRAVVVGGGFIGLEAAENLLHAGVATTLLQKGSQVLPPLDADMAAEVHAYLRGCGVELRLGAHVTGFVPDGEGLSVTLEGGEAVPADLVLLGIGVMPESELARAAGVDYGKAVTYSASHATYYPGAHNMTVKTLYDPATGRILGAQIVGFDGVDKRMDVLATAIRAGLTAADLTELDLAYAPPYGSAKDPVNMAGYVIENLRAGRVEQHHWDEVAGLPADGSVVLLDVRTPGEVRRQGLLRPDAVNIPLDELRNRLGELDPAKKIYVNCFSGLRSYLACRILSQHGYRCSNLAGGWRFWSYNATGRAHDAAPTHLCGIPTGQGK